MPNTLVRVPDITVIPGRPSVAAQPERCVLVFVGTRTVTYQEEITETTTEAPPPPPPTLLTNVQNESLNLYGQQFVAIPSQPLNTSFGFGSSTSGTTTTTTRTVTRTRTEPVYEERCTPAAEGVSGIATQVIRDFGPDWQASARSNVFHPNNASFRFTPVDVVVGGLANASVAPGVRLSQVVYGALVTATGNIQKVFGGAVQAGVLGTTATYSQLEAYVLGGRAFLRGHNGTAWVTLAQDNIIVGDEVFAVGLVHREESSIDAPEFTALTIANESPAGALPLASTLAFTITAEESAVGALPLAAAVFSKVGDRFAIPARGSLPLSSEVGTSITRLISVSGAVGLTSTVSPSVVMGSEIVVPKQLLFAGNLKGAVGDVTVSKPTLEAGSESGDAPVFAFSGAELTSNPPAFSATGVTGSVGGSELNAPKPEFIAADYNYAVGDIVVPAPTLVAGGFSGVTEEARNLDFLFTRGAFAANAALFISFDSGLDVAGDASVLIVMEGALEGALGLGDDVSLAAVLSAAIEDGLFLLDGQQMQAPEQVQYVYNLLSGAVSRFDGFDFRGMVNTPQGTYGYTTDGVYKITDTPSDRPNALVDFGRTTFGTSARKHIETVFVGLRTDGAVFLSMDNGDKEKTYRVIAREPTMRTHTGRGLTGREWGVKLELLDATRAQLDDVEFVVAASTKRWTR